MARKQSHSPLKQWQQQRSQQKIGLLTLYKMQTQASPQLPNQWVHHLPHIEATNTIQQHQPQFKQYENQPENNIFSHRTFINKRRQFQPNSRRKKTDKDAKKSTKKTVAMKEYSFGETNEQELKQNWIRDKIYRQFIVFQGSYPKQGQRETKDALGIVNNRRSLNKSGYRYATNRVHTQTQQATKKRLNSLRKQEFSEELKGETIQQLQSQRTNSYLHTNFWQKRKKDLNFKNPHIFTNALRNHFHLNKNKKSKQNGTQLYQSNLLLNSVQNIPVEVINELSPAGDRLKDMIRKYLKSNERRPFSKKITILQSI